MKWSREEELADFPVHERTRWTTLALRRNLVHIHWREDHPLGTYKAASVGMQLAMTLVFWLASCPLEQALNALDSDPLNPKLKRLWAEPDFQAEHPEGLRFNLHRWRAALSLGQVAPVLGGEGWSVIGLRAWLDGQGGGTPEWEMSLSRERLEVIVETLSSALIFWEIPVTPPLPHEELQQRPGRRRRGRKVNQAG